MTNSNATDPCSAQDCVRASDIGVPSPGDPVAYPHPNCSVHGDPHKFVPGGGHDGAGREFCERCRAYADEHPDECGHPCVRAAVYGIDEPGNLVVCPHPACTEHGTPHEFSPGTATDGAGRVMCDVCREFAAEDHPGPARQ